MKIRGYTKTCIPQHYKLNSTRKDRDMEREPSVLTEALQRLLLQLKESGDDSLSENARDLLIHKLGKTSIQNYVLSIANTLQLAEGKTNFDAVIKQATASFNEWLDKGLVTLVKREDDSKTIDVVPSTSILDIEEVAKSYFIYSKKPPRTKRRNAILHAISLSDVGDKCLQLLHKQERIPLVINSANIQGSHRTPKNEPALNDVNYQAETKLMSDYIAEYDRQIVYQKCNYDRRGRLYTMSYPISFQSDEWNRSVFELYNKEECTEDGLLNLEMDIMNLLGLDKVTIDHKMDAWNLMRDDILSIDSKSITSNGVEILQNANKPIRLISAIRAYKDALDGKPIGYLASIDSTASGSQLAALLTRDELAAKYTNLSSEDFRYDIYTEVAREWYKLMYGTERYPNNISFMCNRKRFKEAVMISGYNGKVAVETNFPDFNEKAAFYEAMNSVCQGMQELTEIVNQAYLDNSDKVYMAWRMPDDFNVIVPQEKSNWMMVKEPSYSFTLKYYKHASSVKENKRSLMPNFIHSCDAYVCRELLRKCSFDIISVHDSFYTHPNNIGKVLKTYNSILQSINELKVDLVGQFLTDIYGVKKKNPFESRPQLSDIRNAKYSLC